MFNVARHPSDDEVLQYIDRELPDNRARLLREHLATCPECRERQASIEARLETLDEFYNLEPADSDSTMAASRARLQETLAQNRASHPSPRPQQPAFRSRLPIAAATALLFVGLAFYAGEQIWKSPIAASSSIQQFVAPNRSLTPGAVRHVTLSQICSSEDNDLDPTVSPVTETAVLREYGVSVDPAVARNYQIDYLVNPQLGGTNDIKNLWPQRYSSGAWDARAKDVLERHLHQMVCDRTVDLATAQREIEVDWIAAYKKYVQQGTRLTSNHS
jgi:Putative zinc-finger